MTTFDWPHTKDKLYASLSDALGASYPADGDAVIRRITEFVSFLTTGQAVGVDVTWFGAKMDGITDDGPAFSAAITYCNFELAAGRMCYLHVPAGITRIVTPLPQMFRHLSIKGAGGFNTVILLDPAYPLNKLFYWSESWITGLTTYANTGNFAAQTQGILVEGLVVVGDRNAPMVQNAFVFADRCDRVVLRDVYCYYIRGRGVWTGCTLNRTQGYLRETAWFNVETRCCGDEATQTPSIEFESNGTGDATNEVWIYGLRVVFSYGPHVRILNNNANIGIRRMFFEGGQIHGFDSLPPSGIVPNNGDLFQIGSDTAAGTVVGLRVRDLTFNAANSGAYCVAVRASSAAMMPYDLYFHVTIGNADGGGFNIDAGRNIEMKIDSAAVTGTLLRVGSTAKVGSNIVWDAAPANTQAGSIFDIDSTVLTAGYFKRIAHIIGSPVGASGFQVQQTIAGTTTNGDARGQGAVDLQSTRASSDQVASGLRAFIGGGLNNKANGTNSVVGGGSSNTASNSQATVGGGLANAATAGSATVGGGSNNTANASQSWIPGGQYGNTRSVIGRGAWGSGFFAGPGDAQAGEAVMRAITTDATPVQFTADGLAAGAANVFNMPTGSTFVVRLLVVARQSSGTAGSTNDSAGWDLSLLIKRIGAGTVSVVGSGGGASIAPTWNDAASAAWRLAVVADDANKGLGISGTGEANKTIRWVARVISVEATG